MTYVAAACLLVLVGPLGGATASFAGELDAKAEACAWRAEDPVGTTDQATVLLQRERGTTGKTRVSALSATRDLPDLPAPFTPESGLTLNASSEDGPVLSFQQGDSPSAAELEHFRLLKEMRKRGHRCPGGRSFAAIPDTDNTFLFDCRLWGAARFWSSEMGNKNFFSHVQGNSNPCSRTSDYGLPACGENIAAGNGDPAAALQQFIESDGHCVNMMDAQYNRFGVGYVQTPGSQWTHYWTQSMGTSSGVDQSCLTSAPPPDATSATTTTTRGVDGPCRDEDVHCASHYQQYCDTEHIQNTCPLTCGLCTAETQTTTPAPSQVCEDKDVHCANHYLQYCDTEHIQNTCPLTCGLCTAETQATTPVCEDKDVHCANHYLQYCDTEHIQNACPLTCGLCSP